MPKYNKEEEEKLIREIIRGIVSTLVFLHSGLMEEVRLCQSTTR